MAIVVAMGALVPNLLAHRSVEGRDKKQEYRDIIDFHCESLSINPGVTNLLRISTSEQLKVTNQEK